MALSASVLSLVLCGGAQAGQISLNPAFASQSNAGFGGAGLALDGNTDGAFFNGSVADTYSTANPFWLVDMKGLFTLNSITIWNRTDAAAQSRLSNYLVQLLDSNSTQVWSSGIISAFPNPSTTLNVIGQSGAAEFLKISLPGQTQELQLAEVQAFGSTTATPEPTTTATLVLGCVFVGLGAVRRRRSLR